MKHDQNKRSAFNGWLAATGLFSLIFLGALWLALDDAWPEEAAAQADTVAPPREVPKTTAAPKPAQSPQVAQRPRTVLPRPTNPIDGLRAFRYLQQLCALGPRPSGSPGMEKQRELLVQHFEQLGGTVTLQRFQARNPLGGPNVPMANVLVTWHPERMERILLCAHYDTRPLPDRDPDPAQRRSGVFLGANDGASGTALLMELAHYMPELEGHVGVDFLLVDGEELVYVDERDPYFLGSTWFAQQHIRQPPPHKYRWGVVLDMIADANLEIYQEQHSVSWRDTRPLVKEIWSTAARLGVDEFIPRARHLVRDDHLPLRNIAKIPTCNIIDFDYPAWHTTMDTPQRCSPGSLAKVGWVVHEWLKEQQEK